MGKTKILLSGFNPLFAEWLREKLDQEMNFNTLVNRNDLSFAEKRLRKEAEILFHYVRNRAELDTFVNGREEHHSSKILAWWSGNRVNEEDIIQALNQGISALICDRHDWTDILNAIKDIEEKGFHHNDLVSEALYHYCKRNRYLHPHVKNPFNELGERERRIIELRKYGKTSKEIASDLFLSKKTIDKMFCDLYRRFDCNNFFELLNRCNGQAAAEHSLILSR